MKAITGCVIASFCLSQVANAREISKLEEQVNRVVVSSYQALPSTGLVSVESMGIGIKMVVRVEGDGKGWNNVWLEKVCSSPPIRKMLAMGGRVTLLAENSAKKRIGEMAFGSDYCSSIGKPIGLDELKN
ncbi:MAG: hypothetical protein HZA62_05150 [Rhodocyclales bacterium]|nr:hypothetical protein [Rhodocyclales bacterium]